MQVILKKDIPQMGRIGELVRVKDGYARNYLIPRNLAAAAHPSNIRQVDHQKKLVEFHKKKVQKESEKLASEMKGLQIVMERRVNESGKLFGSLSTAEIVTELEKKNIKADRRDIEVETIKAEGTYPVKLRLPGDVFVELTLVLKGLQDHKEVKKVGKTAKAKAKKAKAEEESEASTPEDQTNSSEET